MTQIVSVTLPDDVFAALERKAESQGRTVVELAAAAIVSNVSGEAAIATFGKEPAASVVGVRSLFGSLSGSGELANESIDRDLESQYRAQ